MKLIDIAEISETKSVLTEYNTQRTAAAVFSVDKAYRYLLMRTFPGDDPLVIVMCNPSKAGAGRSDPTIRRCVGLAQYGGFGGIVVINLFAAISSDPEVLRELDDPVGQYNSRFQLGAIRLAKKGALCVAWGAFKFIKPQADAFLKLCKQEGVQPQCFGLAKGGAPRHPLYINNHTKLEPYHG